MTYKIYNKGNPDILVFEGDSLQGANLSRANLCGANLCRVDLRKANLYEANLIGANLYEANLSRANLCGANLCKANLRETDLSEANLSGAYLYEANLCGANLCGVDLYKAKGIFSLTTELWSVYITSHGIRIGCKYYTKDEWDSFISYDIEKMDWQASRWWAKYKFIIMELATILED